MTQLHLKFREMAQYLSHQNHSSLFRHCPYLPSQNLRHYCWRQHTRWKENLERELTWEPLVWGVELIVPEGAIQAATGKSLTQLWHPPNQKVRSWHLYPRVTIAISLDIRAWWWCICVYFCMWRAEESLRFSSEITSCFVEIGTLIDLERDRLLSASPKNLCISISLVLGLQIPCTKLGGNRTQVLRLEWQVLYRLNWTIFTTIIYNF